MKIKKFLALLLALIMIFALAVPIGAAVAEADYDNDLAYAEVPFDTSTPSAIGIDAFDTALTIRNESAATLSELTSRIASATAGEQVVINIIADFEIGNAIVIPVDRNIVIGSDIAGGVTLGKVTGNTQRHFTVNGNLTLNDGVTLQGHGHYETNGGGVTINDGTFTMNGGAITANRAGGNGGGVTINTDGTFNMFGGEISGNLSTGVANAAGGVGVAAGGTFNMRGNSIISNNITHANAPGGVRVAGYFNMFSGTIHNNEVQSTNSVGGGVRVVAGGLFTMTGGVISDNFGTGGGGVAIVDASAVFVMGDSLNNGNPVIRDNRTSGNGGGVLISNFGAFVMYNGEIVENVAGNTAGGIDVTTNGTFTMNGGVVEQNVSAGGSGSLTDGMRVHNNGTVNIGNGTISGGLSIGAGPREVILGYANVDYVHVSVPPSIGIVTVPGDMFNDIEIENIGGNIVVTYNNGAPITTAPGNSRSIIGEDYVITALPAPSNSTVETPLGATITHGTSDYARVELPGGYINAPDGSRVEVSVNGRPVICDANHIKDSDGNLHIRDPRDPNRIIPVEPEDDGSYRDGDDNAFIPNPNYPGAGERPFIPVEPEDDGSYRDGDDNAFIPNPNYPGAGERPFIPVEPEDDGSFRDGDDNAFIPNPNYPGAGERPFIPVEPEDDGTFRDEDGNVWRPNPNFPGAGERPFIPVTPDTGGGNQGGTGGNNQGGGTGGAGGGGAGGGTTTPPTTPPTQPPETQPPTTQPSTTTTTPPINNPFTDINSNDWFHNAVMFNHRNGLMVGTSSTMFSPNAPLTRAMIVTLLHRQAGLPNANNTNQFTDVANNTWYTAAIDWAAENDIVLGFGDDTFRPHLHITRQHLALIMARYADFRGIQIPAIRPQANFADSNQIHDYATAAVLRLSAAGIINGRPGNVFDPLGTATRAEVATMMYNFLNAVN